MKQEPITQEIVTLANSEIKKIADRIANTVILAAEKVSVETDFKPARGTFEDVIKKRLCAFDEKKIKSIKERVAPIYNASVEVRKSLYGELGEIVLEDIKSVELEEKLLPPVKINRSILGLWEPPAGSNLSSAEIEKARSCQSDIFNAPDIFSIDAITGGGRVFSDIGSDSDGMAADHSNFEPQSNLGPGDFKLDTTTDKLGLYIRRVKCVDETGGKWREKIGSDEIALGGVSVDETGDVNKISEKFVGGNFDDGDSKWYSPSWRWHWFSMQEGGNSWPKSYFLTFVLAEKDSGGLSEFLEKLWPEIKWSVMAALTAAGVGAGTVFGPVGTGTGAIIGAAVGAAIGNAVGKIIEWFIKMWKDDIFPPSTISITIPSYSARWYRNGNWSDRTDDRRVHFYGHKGHYFIEYYWRVFA